MLPPSRGTPSGGRGHDLKRGHDVLVKFMPLPCNLAAWLHGRWFWSQCERALSGNYLVQSAFWLPRRVCRRSRTSVASSNLASASTDLAIVDAYLAK